MNVEIKMNKDDQDALYLFASKQFSFQSDQGKDGKPDVR